MINIDSNQGRIGEFWWINSDPQPITTLLPLTIGIIDTDMVVKRQLIRWGTCGIGHDIRVVMEQLNDY